jgi:Toprim-like
VANCRAALWDAGGARALAWLHGRGLGDETIKAAGLGYNPADAYHDRAAWGLPPESDEDGHPKRVWLPRGVVIPWVIGGELWRVNVRRPVGDPKYIGPAGCAMGLYNADALTPARPAVLVEGELDALTVGQAAGDLVTAVATGSTSWGHRPRWIAQLALPPIVLVAFDGDDPGEEAARWWLGVLSSGRRWRAYYGKDANGLAQGGGDVRAWVMAGLGELTTPAAGSSTIGQAPGEREDLGTGHVAVMAPAPEDPYTAACLAMYETVEREYWRPGLDAWLQDPARAELAREIGAVETRIGTLCGGDLGEFSEACAAWARLYEGASVAYVRALWANYPRDGNHPAGDGARKSDV